MTQKIPHKHANIIKAWADGATIEFKDVHGNWTEATTPSWRAEVEFRIKSKPISVFQAIHKTDLGNYYSATTTPGKTKEEAYKGSVYYKYIYGYLEFIILNDKLIDVKFHKE